MRGKEKREKRGERESLIFFQKIKTLFTPTPECRGRKPVDEWFVSLAKPVAANATPVRVWGFTISEKRVYAKNLLLLRQETGSWKGNDPQGPI